MRIERYLNLLDTGLKEIFHEKQAPLILAGVDYLLPIYHRVSEYAHIMKEGITGSPEHLRPEEFQEQAWTIVEPYIRQAMEKVVEQYQQLAVTAKATDNIEEIVAAAGVQHDYHLRPDVTKYVSVDPPDQMHRRD